MYSESVTCSPHRLSGRSAGASSLALSDAMCTARFLFLDPRARTFYGAGAPESDRSPTGSLGPRIGPTQAEDERRAGTDPAHDR
jgi:hypothetical protein